MPLPHPTALSPCPCGTGAAYAACCGRLHDGERATSAVQLMRSRYTAYAVGREDHLFRTWHPRTRPGEVSLAASVCWTGLEVIRVVDGGPGDETGTVEFVAGFDSRAGAGRLHETSRFARRAGRWTYVEGDLG